MAKDNILLITTDQQRFDTLNAWGNQKIVSQKDIRIDGTLEGRLECQGKVVIGETGQVIGDIVAVNAEVVGRITGNVMVAEMLVLKATSSLEGDIQARRLAIEPGAVLNGKCTMLQQLDDGGDA